MVYPKSKTEWKEYRLGEIYEVHNGLSKGREFFGSGYPFISFSTVFNKWFIPEIITDFAQTTESEQESYSIKAGDILVTRTSETADELGMSCVALRDIPNATYNGFCKRMRQYNKDVDVDSKYVGYYMRNPEFRKKFQAFAGSMSTRASLTNDALLGLTIKLPPLAEQQRIAKILSSLDDKIELNNAINRNLEEQAQILFKNYEENKPSNLMKIADVAEINPDSFGLKDNWSFVNYLDTSSITQNVISELQYINLNEEKLPSRAKRKVVENDIVYSTVRPNQLHFGFINEVKPNMLVSTGFAVIRSKNPLVSNEYIYLNLTKRDTIEKLQQIAEQSVSTFPAIKPSDIGDCLINVFEKKDAEILNNQLSAVFKKISQNNQENQRLTLIRDTLLPKLMSGEMGAMV